MCLVENIYFIYQFLIYLLVIVANATENECWCFDNLLFIYLFKYLFYIIECLFYFLFNLYRNLVKT